MPEMTKRERVRAALAGAAVDRTPFALWGHDFLREWSPEELVAATLDAYRTDGYDFIKFNPRWTYFAEAWGNNYTRPTEQRMPRLTTAIVGEASHLAKIAADRQAVGQLTTAGGTRALLVEIPLMRDDVHDVTRLVGLERYLLG